MSTTLSVNNHEVEITKKDIKNIHLSVHPPNGKIRVSAPLKIEDSSIKAFVLTKLEWIKKHQNRLKNQEREAKRELVNRESIFVWGNRYLIQLENTMKEEDVSLNGNKLIMSVNLTKHLNAAMNYLNVGFENKLGIRQNLLSKGGKQNFL